MAQTFLQISGIGRLAKAPEARTVGQHNSKVVQTTIAVNLRVKGVDGQWKDSSRFYQSTMWGAKSDALVKMTKGEEVYFSGELNVEEWMDKTTNQPKQAEKVELSKIVSLEPRQPRATPPAAAHAPQAGSAFASPMTNPIDEDETIPF